jgi:hypothetical protein
MSGLGVTTMVIVLGSIWGGFGYFLYRNVKDQP